MGCYNFAPTRVHRAVTQLLESKRMKQPPPWYDVVADVPPPQQLLVRPLLRSYAERDAPRNGRKPSRMFQPISLAYPEDRLRHEFFTDHPWELARPRVILEDDGTDSRRRDWGSIMQPGKKLDGESVVQRQRWLMRHNGMGKAAAYDQARRELYEHRYHEAIEKRVAKEEAQAVGAYFGLSPLEAGMEIENRTYNGWKAWAIHENEAQRHSRAAMFSGAEIVADAVEVDNSETLSATDELGDSISGTKEGKRAPGCTILQP